MTAEPRQYCSVCGDSMSADEVSAGTGEDGTLMCRVCADGGDDDDDDYDDYEGEDEDDDDDDDED